MESYILFKHPRDYPQHYVLRRYAHVNGAIHPRACWIAYDPKSLRAMIPAGLTRYPRHHGEPEDIVETWF